MDSATLNQFGMDQLEFFKLWILIPLFCTSTLAVAIGVYLEKEQLPQYVQELGWKMLLWGLAFEILWGGLIFAVDAGVSSLQRIDIKAQQSKIIALETRIAPRHIDKDQQAIIAKALRGFPSPQFDLCITPGVEDDFVTELRETLVAGGWTIRNFGGEQATPEQLAVPEGKIPGIGVCSSTGVNIFMDPKLESQFGQSAALVRLALSKLGIAASAYTMETDAHMRADTMHVQIGNRL
jgi:hypothetical protein